jgi:hypothetical protein
MSPDLRRWLEGARLKLLPADIRAVFECQAPLDLLTPQSVDELMFRLAGLTPVEHGEHRV